MILPPASHTFLNDYENCPRKAFHKHVARDVEREDSPALDFGRTMHKSMERRLAAGVPLPEEFGQYEPLCSYLQQFPAEVELKLGILIDGTACRFYDVEVHARGVLDWTYVKGDSALLFDWKSGKVREDPDELRLHALLLKARYRNLTHITGHYVWMNSGGTVGEPHDLSDVDHTWKSLAGRWNMVNRYAALDHWPPRENYLCKWCPVTQCQFNKKGQ